MYDRILSYVLSTPWAITTEYLALIAEVLARRIAGHPFTDEEIAARVQAGQERAASRGGAPRVGAVAVLPILGAILPRSEAMDTSGAVSVQQLDAAFEALVADESVGAIVLDMDSPGGSVGGVAEFAARVFAARERKPVIALARPMMASAAYWIGAGAAELVVTPSALVGAIGVYSAHTDLSEALAKEGVKVTLLGAGAKKLLGNPFEALSDEGRAEIQKRVDTFYTLFVQAVARGRGVSQAAVREGFGQGGIVNAEEAVKLGMADQVGTLDDAIALAARKAQRSAARAEGFTVRTTDAANDDTPAVAVPTSAERGEDLDLRRRRLRAAEAS